MSTHRYPGGVISATPPTASTSTAVGVWTLEEALRNKAAGNWPDGSGADPYFNYTTLLLHGDGTNGAQNNTFLDSSTNNFTITRNGNPTQGSFDPYVGPGNWSIYFNGTTDYLTSTSTSIVPTGTESFTIEMWFYKGNAWNAVNQLLFFGAPTGVQIWVDAATTSLKLSYNSALILSYSAASLSTNTWYHLAIARNGSAIAMDINGSQGASGADSTSIPAPSSVIIGNYNTGTTNVWNGYISNLRIVRGVALYTSAFTTPTTPLVSTTQTTLLNCNNNGFNDFSGGNISFTRSGTPQISKFSPFTLYQTTPTSYSGYFDGTGDYLTAPANAAYAFGTGDFTVEAWVYPVTRNATYGSQIAGPHAYTVSADWLFIINTTGNLYFQIGSSSTGAQTSTSTVSLNTWSHVAVVRSSGTVTFYINGVAAGSGSYATSIANTQALGIGAANNGNSATTLTGSISNIRITKGQALYTTGFTPSTSPLTTTSQGATAANVSLLTCQSTTFIDNSTNAFTITVNGNARPIAANPFTDTVTGPTPYSTTTYGGSAYFDGTGDYLTVPDSALLEPGSNNFTVECWFYMTGANPTNGAVLFSKANTSSYGPITVGFTTTGAGSGITALSSATGSTWGINLLGTATATTLRNSWNHVAYVRNGNVFTLYLNGAVAATTTNAIGALVDNTELVRFGQTNFTATDFPGFISNLRYVVGTAVYTGPFVPPTAPVTAITNTQLLLNATNAGIFDNTTVNDIETAGSAQVNTTIVKYGTGSISFNGTTDYIISAPRSNVNNAFGTGNFTVELWVYPTAFASYKSIYGNSNGITATGWHCGLNASGNVFIYSNSAFKVTSSNTLTLNAWNHVAIVRNGSTVTIYIGGTSGGTWTLTTETFTDGYCFFGVTPGFASEFYSGYMDDIRITKGYARYTANFTPPASAFPNI